MRGFRCFYMNSLIAVLILWSFITAAGCEMTAEDGTSATAKETPACSIEGSEIYSPESIFNEFSKGVTKLTYRVTPALSIYRDPDDKYTLGGTIKVYKIDSSYVRVDSSVNYFDMKGGDLGSTAPHDVKIVIGKVKLDKGEIVNMEYISEIFSTEAVKYGGFINKCVFSFFLSNSDAHSSECFAPPCIGEPVYLIITAPNEECLK